MPWWQLWWHPTLDAIEKAGRGASRGPGGPPYLAEQVEKESHPAHYEQDEADPHENVERFLLRRGRVDPNRHVKTTDQPS